ncbi:MAG: hypothetical protein HKO98_15785 [Gemmatimonadetes bacterium]|nr:hypothetical protein [Gemmatimonadota bacterium]
MRLVARRKSDQNRVAVDPWTAVHLATGLAAGLMEISAARALGAALGYEVAEQWFERSEAGQDFFEVSGPEHPSNVVLDLVVFAAGHWLGRRWNRTG